VSGGDSLNIVPLGVEVNLAEFAAQAVAVKTLTEPQALKPNTLLVL
jgi:hypothetical protein